MCSRSCAKQSRAGCRGRAWPRWAARARAPRAGGRARWRAGRGLRGGPALPPAASWGFHKYLLNKETTAFAFPVIVALAPPPRGEGWGGPSLHGPFSPPPCRPVPGRLDGSSGRSQGRTLGSPRALQSGTQAPPLPTGPSCLSVRTSSSASTWAPAPGLSATRPVGEGSRQAQANGVGPRRREGPRRPWAAAGGGQASWN